MRKARNHTLHLLKWSVGKGDQIRFWDDSWLTTSPLSQLHTLNQIQQFCSQTWGTLVADYIDWIERVTDITIQNGKA